MSDLGTRSCKIGSGINTRTEKHGDEDVPAADVPIEGIMLTSDELDALVPGAHRAWFRKQPRTDFYDLTEFAKRLSPFKYADKFENAEALLTLGIDGKEISLDTEVKIAKLKFTPQPGGLTELAITLQCTPTTDVIADLFAFMGREITAEITYGVKAEPKKRKQTELPLDHNAGEQDADEEGDEEQDVDTDLEDDDETEAPPSIGPRTQEELDRLSRLASGKGKH